MPAQAKPVVEGLDGREDFGAGAGAGAAAVAGVALDIDGGFFGGRRPRGGLSTEPSQLNGYGETV